MERVGREGMGLPCLIWTGVGYWLLTDQRMRQHTGNHSEGKIRREGGSSKKTARTREFTLGAVRSECGALANAAWGRWEGRRLAVDGAFESG